MAPALALGRDTRGEGSRGKARGAIMTSEGAEIGIDVERILDVIKKTILISKGWNALPEYREAREDRSRCEGNLYCDFVENVVELYIEACVLREGKGAIPRIVEEIKSLDFSSLWTEKRPKPDHWLRFTSKKMEWFVDHLSGGDKEKSIQSRLSKLTPALHTMERLWLECTTSEEWRNLSRSTSRTASSAFEPSLNLPQSPRGQRKPPSRQTSRGKVEETPAPSEKMKGQGGNHDVRGRVVSKEPISIGRRPNLSSMITSGVLRAGKDVLVFRYKGVRYKATLSEDGFIFYNGEKYRTPTAWSCYIKSKDTSGKKTGDGWAQVTYNSKPLRHWLSCGEQQKAHSADTEEDHIEDDSQVAHVKPSPKKRRVNALEEVRDGEDDEKDESPEEQNEEQREEEKEEAEYYCGIKLISVEDAVERALRDPKYRIPTVVPKRFRAKAQEAVKRVKLLKRRT